MAVLMLSLFVFISNFKKLFREPGCCRFKAFVRFSKSTLFDSIILCLRSMMLVKSTANTSSNSSLTTNFEKYKYVQCLLIFEIHLSIISCKTDYNKKSNKPM